MEWWKTTFAEHKPHFCAVQGLDERVRRSSGISHCRLHHIASSNHPAWPWLRGFGLSRLPGCNNGWLHFVLVVVGHADPPLCCHSGCSMLCRPILSIFALLTTYIKQALVQFLCSFSVLIYELVAYLTPILQILNLSHIPQTTQNVPSPTILATGIWSLPSHRTRAYPIFPWAVCFSQTVYLPGKLTSSDLRFAT